MQPKDELVQAWLQKAAHDFGSAKVLFRHTPEYEDTIAFHCQQAVEKTLKGYMVWLNIFPPKTHDLAKLARQITDAGHPLPDFFDEWEELTHYAVESRYPDEELPKPIPVSYLLSITEKHLQEINKLFT